MKKDIAQFQFITQDHETLSHVEQARLVCEAGGRWIQYRRKNIEGRIKEQEALEIRGITKSYEAVMIVNDDVNLAKIVQADGVHLGQDDMSVQRARMILGKKIIIGKTCNTLEHINEINESHVDYIGLGPFRHTTTKENLSPILGLDGYEKILSQQKHDIPVVGIGSVKAEDVKDLLETGLHGVAVSGAVLNGAVKEDVCSFFDELE